MTESELYCIGMESDIAYRHMRELCELLGYPFPPRLNPPETAVREVAPDPILETA